MTNHVTALKENLAFSSIIKREEYLNKTKKRSLWDRLQSENLAERNEEEKYDENVAAIGSDNSGALQKETCGTPIVSASDDNDSEILNAELLNKLIYLQSSE